MLQGGSANLGINIHKTIILPVVLYQYEMCLLSKQTNIMSVQENTDLEEGK